ncbi:MAG: exosortase/archaeosortase family protein [Phycisphaerales bacterium]|nr:exosortase/archaeosortase family protein [Phycisphaerales bacterium]
MSRARAAASVPTAIGGTRSISPVWLALGVLAAALAWSYLPTILELNAFWSRNEDYSVGRLVPFVAAFIVWRRRAELAALPLRPAWSGVGLLLAAELLRFAGVWFGSASGERYALVLAIAGLVLLAGGWSLFVRLRWVLLFLVLMIPLPARVHESIAVPLQNAATQMTAFSLELFGYYINREGNIIRMEGGTQIAVTEACSGLRMLSAFVFIAATLAFFVRGPWWRRAILVASSLPIAVLANAIRGFATALFVHYARNPTLNLTFHDFAGLAMMPLALLMLWGVLKSIDFVQGVFHEPQYIAPASASRRRGRAAGNGRSSANRPGGGH